MLASEIKALFALGVPRRWDRLAYAHAGGMVVPEPGRTHYEGIQTVPPGHYIVASDRYFQIVQYWDIDYPRRSDEAQLTDEEATEAVREALDEAVRIRLRADVPVGVYLSGGIDSCAVLGLAARHRKDAVQAFSLTFSHEIYDESPIAKEMAEYVHGEAQLLHVQQADLATNFEDAIWHCELPTSSANFVAKYLLSKTVREAGYKVVLTGEGADEIFAGYPNFRLDSLLAEMARNPDKARQAIEDLKRTNVAFGSFLKQASLNPPGMEVISRTVGFVSSQWALAVNIGRTLRSLFSSDFLTECGDVDDGRLATIGLNIQGQIRGRDPLNQALYVWAKRMFPASILVHLGDRVEMAHSVEGRLPFLDHKLVETVARLSPSQKIRGKTEKFVLREAVKSVVTPRVYNREKHPFTSPPSTLFDDQPLFGLVQDTLRGSELRRLGFYDPAKVAALLDSVPKMDQGERIGVDRLVILILSACLLNKRFALSA